MTKLVIYRKCPHWSQRWQTIVDIDDSRQGVQKALDERYDELELEEGDGLDLWQLGEKETDRHRLELIERNSR